MRHWRPTHWNSCNTKWFDSTETMSFEWSCQHLAASLPTRRYTLKYVCMCVCFITIIDVYIKPFSRIVMGPPFTLYPPSFPFFFFSPISACQLSYNYYFIFLLWIFCKTLNASSAGTQVFGSHQFYIWSLFSIIYKHVSLRLCFSLSLSRAHF
jgi:hypothetical protein